MYFMSHEVYEYVRSMVRRAPRHKSPKSFCTSDEFLSIASTQRDESVHSLGVASGVMLGRAAIFPAWQCSVDMYCAIR